MTSENPDDKIEVSEEQKKLDQFDKLCRTVKDNIGIDEIHRKLEAIGEYMKNLTAQVGDTSQKVEQMIPHINRWIQLENGAATQPSTTATGSATEAPKGTMSTLTSMPKEVQFEMMKQAGQGLAEVLKGLAEAYRTFKGQDAAPSSFLGIDENVIKENIKESILGDFETGKAMREMLTGGLKRKVVNKAVTQMLEDNEVVHTI